MLLTREERYVNPINCREDTYEGYHLHRLDSAESSRKAIRYLHDELCDGDVGLTVLYDLDGTDRLGNVIKKCGRTDAPYFHKRSAFRHEEEVRILLYDSKAYDSLSGFQAQALRATVAGMDPALPVEERIARASRDLFGEGDESVLRRVSDTSVTVYVTNMGADLVGVRVHPLAEAWYAGLVERLCDEHYPV